MDINDYKNLFLIKYYKSIKEIIINKNNVYLDDIIKASNKIKMSLV